MGEDVLYIQLGMLPKRTNFYKMTFSSPGTWSQAATRICLATGANPFRSGKWHRGYFRSVTHMRGALFAEISSFYVASSAISSSGEWWGHVILVYELDARESLLPASLLPFKSVFVWGFLPPLSLWQVEQGNVQGTSHTNKSTYKDCGVLLALLSPTGSFWKPRAWSLSSWLPQAAPARTKWYSRETSAGLSPSAPIGPKRFFGISLPFCEGNGSLESIEEGELLAWVWEASRECSVPLRSSALKKCAQVLQVLSIWTCWILFPWHPKLRNEIVFATSWH